MAYDQVGAQFAQFYYTAMQKDKDALKNLYVSSFDAFFLYKYGGKAHLIYCWV